MLKPQNARYLNSHRPESGVGGNAKITNLNARYLNSQPVELVGMLKSQLK
jgi:hypothetical protein